MHPTRRCAADDAARFILVRRDGVIIGQSSSLPLALEAAESCAAVVIDRHTGAEVDNDLDPQWGNAA